MTHSLLLALSAELLGLQARADAAAAIQRQLDSIEARIIAMDSTFKTALDGLVGKVSAQTTVVASTNALLASLKGQLDAAVAKLGDAGVQPADLAELQGIADGLEANTRTLGQAVAANTAAAAEPAPTAAPDASGPAASTPAPVAPAPAAADSAAPQGAELTAQPG